jgi:hypothetical protein
MKDWHQMLQAPRQKASERTTMEEMARSPVMKGSDLNMDMTVILLQKMGYPLTEMSKMVGPRLAPGLIRVAY